MTKKPTLTLAGGRITCHRCQATSKRTRDQCKAPAAAGKSVCRFHGAASTGPRTAEGRQRCADARMIHGQSTRAARAEPSEELAVLAELEELARQIGLIDGPRSRGRRPGWRKG